MDQQDRLAGPRLLDVDELTVDGDELLRGERATDIGIGPQGDAAGGEEREEAESQSESGHGRRVYFAEGRHGGLPLPRNVLGGAWSSDGPSG